MAKIGIIVHTYMSYDWSYAGTAKNDFIYSGDYNDYVVGGKGNDLIGDDWESGTTVDSDDVFIGGSGADKLVSYSGDDFLFGGKGDDRLFVYAFGQDVAHSFVDGGKGDDALILVPQQDGTGSWHRIEDSRTEQTITAHGHEVDIINVEAVYY